jgi:predicted  nucleic acid-binding Zn-ribbon protein
MGVTNPMLNPIENKWPAYQEGSTEPDYRRRSKAVWAVVVALAAVLGASFYYGHLALNKQNIQVSQLFGSQAALNALGQRVDTAEGKLQELTGGWEGLGQRVTKLESLQSRVRANLEQTRKYAEGLTQQMHQQLSAELEARNSALDARLRQVESEQTAQRSQLAQVEADLRQGITSVTSVQEQTGSDLSGVHRQVEANARDLNALSQRLDPKRVDFELTKGQTEELVPGVSLRISGTNPLYQRYRASLWLLQDRRTLWLRDQSVHQPVRFFHKETAEPYELVVTDVTKKFVIGYLLVPVRPEAVGTLADQRTATDTSGDD